MTADSLIKKLQSLDGGTFRGFPLQAYMQGIADCIDAIRQYPHAEQPHAQSLNISPEHVQKVERIERDEPTITINGLLLTTASAMTVRCAIEAFASSMADGLGNDEHGKAMADGYSANISAIRRMMGVV